jgi:catechol 2,3-dioxygenase-like lactoylglutathione lyase family enzyme
MDMKLEVIVVPVFDVDRAQAFYEKLGWRLDLMRVLCEWGSKHEVYVAEERAKTGAESTAC